MYRIKSSFKGRKQWGILCLGLLLMLYLAQLSFADDAIAIEEPTLVAAEPATATVIPLDEPVIEVSDVAQPSPTLSVSEPTAIPTTVLITPSDVPAVDISQVSPTPVEVVATIPPGEAAITLIPSATRLTENSVVSLAVTAQGLTGAYGVTLVCQVDPTALLGVQAVPGDLLSSDQSSIADSGFQSDGQWGWAERQIDTAPELGSGGVLWNLSYQVIGSGLMQIACQAQIIDRSGQPMSLAISDLTLTIEGYSDAMTTAPIVEATELASPLPETPVDVQLTPTLDEATEVVSPTPELSTDIPMLDPANATVHFSGHVQLASVVVQGTVTITGIASRQTIAVQNDGSFAIDLPTGSYQLIISAPQHLPLWMTVNIGEQPFVLPAITLLSGDVNGDGTIDSTDAALIVDSFGLSVPPAPSSTDLNGDGVTNIYDLSILSANIHPAG